MESFDFEYTNMENDISSIRCKVLAKGGVKILDSFETNNDISKMIFLKNLMQNLSIDFGKRDLYSLFIEWKAHNILYKKHFFRKHTKDTSLDPKESCIKRLFYRVVCFIFSDK